jgi:hypothetical protein
VNYIRLLSTVHTAGDEEVLRLRFWPQSEEPPDVRSEERRILSMSRLQKQIVLRCERHKMLKYTES